MKMLMFYGFGVLCVTSSVVESKIKNDHHQQKLVKFQPKYYKLLDAEQFQSFKESPLVGAVIFYKSHDPEGKMEMFLSEYDKSAGFLNAYGLKLGLVDCSSMPEEPLLTACQENEQKVSAYRRDKKILALDLETMFDVNSITSNILQLALLDEVSIIQTKKNQLQLQYDSAGQTDIIYSYHDAIGTYEHRVVMEIAYAYQDKYKFAITTEPGSTEDLQDYESINVNTVSMIWVLYCRDSFHVKTGCRSVHYRGEISLLTLANFFKFLSWPRVTYRKMKHTGNLHPCEESMDTPCVLLFHSLTTKDKMEEVVMSIQFDIHGHAGLIVVEMDDADAWSKSSPDPQITLKMSGGNTIVMQDSWTLEHIEYFLASNLFPDSETDPAPAPVAGSAYDESEQVETIDDMVMGVAWDLRGELGKNCPNIPALTDKTFPTTVNDSELAVVFFYLPYDAQGMLFLESLHNASLKLAAHKGGDTSAHPLVRVNCFDWTDVCQKENVTIYPVIRFYREGGKIVQPYRHAFDEGVLLRTVRLLQAEQPLILKTAEEVESFAGGSLPEKMHEDVVNFVLLKSESEKEVKAFTEVVKRLETQMLFAIVDPSVQSKILPKHGVLHLRLGDMHEPSEELMENLDEETIYNFLVKNQFHLLPELTHLNFPAFYARKQRFGILFQAKDTEDSVAQTVVSLIKNKRFTNIIFCRMTLFENDGIAATILKEYAGKIHLPTFAIVDHQKGGVFVKELDLSETGLLSWIMMVDKGSVAPAKILEKGEWKPPGRHYDFLSKIDQEEKNMKKNKHSMPDQNCPSGDCDKYEAFMDDDTQSDRELEDQDQETRAQLLELQNSRLYSGKHHHLHIPDQTPPKLASDKPEETSMMKEKAKSKMPVKKTDGGKSSMSDVGEAGKKSKSSKKDGDKVKISGRESSGNKAHMPDKKSSQMDGKNVADMHTEL